MKKRNGVTVKLHEYNQMEMFVKWICKQNIRLRKKTTATIRDHGFKLKC